MGAGGIDISRYEMLITPILVSGSAFSAATRIIYMYMFFRATSRDEDNAISSAARGRATSIITLLSGLPIVPRYLILIPPPPRALNFKFGYDTPPKYMGGLKYADVQAMFRELLKKWGSVPASRHNKCWFTAGPLSTTSDQRKINIDSTSCAAGSPLNPPLNENVLPSIIIILNWSPERPFRDFY